MDFKSVNILLPTSVHQSFVVWFLITCLFPQYLPTEHVALYTQISRKLKRAICSWRTDTLICVFIKFTLTHFRALGLISATPGCY